MKSLRWKHFTGMDKSMDYDLEKGSQGSETQTIPSQRSEHPKPIALPPRSNNDVSGPPAYNEAIYIWLYSQLYICLHEKHCRGIKSSLTLQKITILCIWLWNFLYVSCNSKIRKTSGAEDVVWVMSIAMSPWRTGKPISYHHQFAAEFADAKLRLLQFDVSNCFGKLKEPTPLMRLFFWHSYCSHFSRYLSGTVTLAGTFGCQFYRRKF